MSFNSKSSTVILRFTVLTTSMEKYSNVSSSSLIGLKAELIRKQQELSDKKLKGVTSHKPKPFAKPASKGGKNVGVPETVPKDFEETEEERIEFEKSKKMLEAKAALYEQLRTGKRQTDEDIKERFLVDFERKVQDPDNDEVATCEEAGQSSFDDNLQDEPPAPEHPDEEWVDYIDSFGRSRRCLKKDLPDMANKKKEIIEEESSESQSGLATDEFPPAPVREGPIHYQNVQANEVRNHGVGYFAFSEDDMERRKQMELLQSLRGQTQEQVARREKVLEKRKSAMAARLAKVREKTLVKMGLPADYNLKPQDVKEEAEEVSPIGPLPAAAADDQSRLVKPAEESATVNTKQKIKVRPWDVGKEGLQQMLLKKRKNEPISQEQWVDKKRAERPAEFAPPALYGDFVPAKDSSVPGGGSGVRERHLAGESGTRNVGGREQWNNVRTCENSGSRDQGASWWSEQSNASPQGASSTEGQNALPGGVNRNIEEEISAGLKFFRSQSGK